MIISQRSNCKMMIVVNINHAWKKKTGQEIHQSQTLRKNFKNNKMK